MPNGEVPITLGDVLDALADIERRVRVMQEVLSEPGNVDFSEGAHSERVRAETLAGGGRLWRAGC